MKFNVLSISKNIYKLLFLVQFQYRKTKKKKNLNDRNEIQYPGDYTELSNLEALRVE